MLRDEEHMVWQSAHNPHGESETSTSDSMAALRQRMPELIRAGGDVDPIEAMIHLIDQVQELSKKVEDGTH